MTVLAKGRQWVSHRGSKQKRRHMRQRCASVMRTKEPEIVKVVERLAAACDGGREDPYLELYPMICEAMSEAEETGARWVDGVNATLDQFEAAA